MKSAAFALAATISAASLVVTPERASGQAAVKSDIAAIATLPVVDSTSLKSVISTLAGYSGKLLARFALPPHSMQIPILASNLSYSSRAVPEIQQIAGASELGVFSIITMKSFGDKIAGYVGNYRVGYWPEEKGRLRSEAYNNPDGFIEVTPENQDLRISEHFRLKDFLTHDQHQIWPKYLVLREPLLDKLELVLDDLADHGIPVSTVHVLSGFRTPQYNLALGDRSGRARDSRHQFGDAADIVIDSNNDGRMDDLNHDGRVNVKDIRVILAAVERVEQKYPDLVGGVGLYHSNGEHGPFAHIDVRGEKVRWTNTVRVARHSSKARVASSKKKAKTKKS